VLEGAMPCASGRNVYRVHGDKGLHHLVYEVVDNSIDEALAGYCDTVEVNIHIDNSITVIDNGRGIPVDMMKKEKRSASRGRHDQTACGGKFDSMLIKSPEVCTGSVSLA